MSEAATWATSEFAQAELGDQRRVSRLILVAAAAALRPSGKVTEVFSEGAQQEQEVEAIVRLARPKEHRRGTMPTIGDAILWLAYLGGYTGKSSGGPPGAIVLARGLRRIEPLVDVLIAESEM
jgi:hypothetical protein